MGTIRVEAVPVRSYGLGLLRFDHLQLVFQDETDLIDRQDYWFVLEGVQDGGLTTGTLGINGHGGRMSLGAVNGAGRDELVDQIGTPELRGSRIIKSGSDALTAWDTMANYGAGVEEQKFPYIAFSTPFGAKPTINSTSLVSTLLWSIGIDLNNLMPFNIRLSPGPETILGTPENDDMSADLKFTPTVATGVGDDTLHGSGQLHLGRQTLWRRR